MSLNKKTLESEIQSAFEDILPGAFEAGLKKMVSTNSELADEQCKQFGETITELLAAPLAKALASAIDYHVRSANVYGKIITNGGPSTQMAVIQSPSPITNGNVPNTLGIR